MALTWEWHENGRAIIVHKSRGKITFDEVWKFFHDPKMTNIFDGALIVDLFRVNADRDSYGEENEDPGDSQMFWVWNDENPTCPVCGDRDLTLQYCPECGTKLFGEVRR